MGGDSGTYCAGMPCCCSLRSTKRFKRPRDAPPAAGPAAAAVPLDAAPYEQILTVGWSLLFVRLMVCYCSQTATLGQKCPSAARLRAIARNPRLAPHHQLGIKEAPLGP